MHFGTGSKHAACVLGFALAIITATASADTPPQISPAKTMAEAGMVDIRSLVPDMAENIHYAGSDNFTGAPVSGYRAAKCFLLKRPPKRWRASNTRCANSTNA